jgi:TolB protein
VSARNAALGVKGGPIFRTNKNFAGKPPVAHASACISLSISFTLAALLLIPCLAFAQSSSQAQDQKPAWFQTGTGMGVSKTRIAVADFAGANPSSQPLGKQFSDVVRADLDYSGIIDLVSPSMYPLQVPSQPSELNAQTWADAPASAQALAFGSLNASGNSLAIQAWLNDVRNTSAPPMIAKIYRGEVTDAQVRIFAHQFADEIIMKLSGGLPGISTTQIAFVSTRAGGNKEIWAMDYDGSNQHQLTSLRSIALTPRWSPDAQRIAFTCYVPGRTGVTSAQICMYSVLTGKLISWPRYTGTNSSPAWSPDGASIMFMSSMQGNPDIYVSDANGGRPKRITFSVGVNTSPVWNPKTGQQVAFVSDRAGGGHPQLYTMNIDGTGTEKIELQDAGYVIDPSWSPNGELLAFSWQRPNGNYDIYAMSIVDHKLVQLTRDTGRNERPCWAPDGRHIAFESTRTGTRQIWSMLADGTQTRQLTTQGTNESPNWSAPRQ